MNCVLVRAPGKRRAGAALAADKRECLIESGHPDEAVNDGAQAGHFSELHPKDGGYEIESSNRNQAPIERTDNNEHGREHINRLHRDFLSLQRRRIATLSFNFSEK
jgi:hypothetical protein